MERASSHRTEPAADEYRSRVGTIRAIAGVNSPPETPPPSTASLTIDTMTDDSDRITANPPPPPRPPVSAAI
jgi:hypothetical protein